MKIVYYVPELYIHGGLERVIIFKANYFAQHFKNCSVTIITSEQQGKPLFCPLSGNVSHVDLNVLFDSQRGQNKFIKLIKYPFKYYRFKGRFSKFLMQYKPDITISTLRREVNFINNVQDGSVKIGEFHVTRSADHAIPTRGQSSVLGKLKAIYEKNFVKNLQKFRKVVLLTKGEAEYWPELANTVVINNPVSIFPDCASDGSAKQVIAVGRFAYEKGFDRLINSWKMISERYPDWALCICGYGDGSWLEKQIHALGLESSCMLKYNVSDIVEEYCNSSILAVSSRYEGFGMVLVEAMTCGLPVVSFDCPTGPKEIIKHGEDGFLVENGNITQFADRICYLIGHEDERKKLGQRGRINAKRFNVENIGQQWKSLFDSLVSSHNE